MIWYGMVWYGMYGNAMYCNAMQRNVMKCTAMQCKVMKRNTMQCNVLFVCMHMQCEYAMDPYCWDGLQSPVDVSVHFLTAGGAKC